MKHLCHQHICQLYEVVETDDEIHMVMEVSVIWTNVFSFFSKMLDKT